MDHLPIFLDIRSKTVVVSGGGTLAARRIERALSAGAHVKVFASEPTPELDPFLANPDVTHFRRPAEPDDLSGAILAYGAEENFDNDKKLHDLARAAGVLVNVADTMELCDFITPAILDRTPFVAAISSSGASPILARTIKAELESTIPATIGDLSYFLARFRDEVAERIADGTQRRRFWEDVAESVVGERVMAGDIAGAETAFYEKLEAFSTGSGTPVGEVYLVGTGPGDPDLLTFRALRLMQRADVVLYDRLIGPRIMSLVRRDAERIYVGKKKNEHTMGQEDISRLLATLALEGKRVLRLKGGDPFIFGRGGEEIEEIARHDIPFQVVPGITAAAGCAAYAGIPLTHRDHAQTCIFVTGHAKDGEVDLNWKALIQPNQTVAIYMGLGMISQLASSFLKHGMSPDMPVAVVDKGTRRRQRVVTGKMSDITKKVDEAALDGPAIIVIGTVVTLRDKLAWFAGSAEVPQTGSTA
ncbi:MAG: siroheme synthase CysG [Hyphomicrobiales bacterium]|nr:siroheme synthase CysG [Hyphomicrobiales bacterium]